MEDTQTPTEGVQVEATVEQPAQETQQEQPKDNTKFQRGGAVNYYKEQLAEAQRANEQLASQMEEFKTQELEKQQRYKELWEAEKVKRSEIETNNQKNYSSFMETLKANAIEKEAIRLGLRKEAMQDLDLVDKSMLEIESTSTGKINILGVNDFLENLKLNRPHWFGDATPPKINNAVPSGEPQKMTGADILKLQTSNPAEYNRIMRERLSQRS